ncbi:hypothetical protein [Dickeya poaceiphila]|nr:hypothetical protein [Dickeya poaceiphila]
MSISKLPPLSPSVIRRILFYLLMLLFCQQLAMIFWRIGLPNSTPVASVQIIPAQAKQQPVTLN